jgi:hypothetical protein
MKTTILAICVPAASAAKSCTPPADPTAGGQFASLKVRKVSCSTGSKVAVAFETCRAKTGPAGRCVKLVKGYVCREIREPGPTEISERVTCQKGKRKKRKTVSLGYRQATAG